MSFNKPAVLFCVLCILFCITIAEENFYYPSPCNEDAIDFSCFADNIYSKKAEVVAPYNIPFSSQVQFGNKLCTYYPARHHIIPYTRIRNFFQLAANHTSTKVHDLITDFIGNILIPNAVERSWPFKETEVLDIKISDVDLLSDANIREFFDSPYRLDQLVANKKDRKKLIAVLLRWMPFNWFHGPAKVDRIDDSLEEFDISSERIIGTEAYDKLCTINEHIENIENGPRNTKESDFLEIIELFKEMIDLKPNGYGPLSKDNWNVKVSRKTSKCKFYIPALLRGSSPSSRDSITLTKNDNGRTCHIENIDLYCLNSYKKILNSSYYYDKIKHIWFDMNRIHLTNANDIVKSLQRETNYMSPSIFESWLHFMHFQGCTTIENSGGYHERCKDSSHALLIKMKVSNDFYDKKGNLVTDHWSLANGDYWHRPNPKTDKVFKYGYLMIDRDGRPAAVCFRNPNGYINFNYYINGDWRWHEYSDFYSIFSFPNSRISKDQNAPQFYFKPGF